MQLTQENKKPVSLAKITEIIVRENAFIKDLFSKMWMPPRYEEGIEEPESEQKIQFRKVDSNKSRAQSLTELQQRLDALRNKKDLSYKDKMLKKGIKNKLKKKDRREQRKTQKVLVNVGKVESTEIKKEVTERPAKPVFNSEGKMVFSKFDFSNLGNENQKKPITDPKKLLQKLEKQNQKINELKESGDVDKAIKIKDKTEWKNALAKAAGEKVKDDPKLLKKSIKKREQKHRSSKKKWDAREETVLKQKEERQQKRQENIDKRKKSKKLTKLKKASKKGKIIPGF